MAEPPVVALYGATALGKSDIAVALAERLGAEIVVADSMQVYAGLSIVTNQPDERQRARATHHLVGFVPPQEEFTVAAYARAAHAVIERLMTAGRRVVIEGGSGLYLRAALGDLDFLGAHDPSLRRDLEERWSHDPTGVLDELRRLDAATYARLDRSNPRRVLRALEAVRAKGRPLSVEDHERLWRPAERYVYRLVALVPDDDRQVLRARIDARVERMLADGAVDEVRAARLDGPLSRTARQAIGVEEALACLDGALSPAQARASMQSRTRALARRQLTWMRKLPDSSLVRADSTTEAIVERILGLLSEGPW